jgi:hypothetical protein
MDPRFFSRKGYDTDLLILRSLFALSPTTNMPISTNYILTTDGIGGLVWESGMEYYSTTLGLPYGLSTGKLSTSLVTLSTMGIMDIASNQMQILSASNGQLFLNGIPLVAGSGVTQGQLVSTVVGLGTAGYVSTSLLNNALTSTVSGLGTAGYISTSFLNAALTSTTVGLGSIGYVSTSYLNTALTSSINGLGTAGYVSTSYLTKYVDDINTTLGSLGYVSSSQLLSTSESLLSYVNSFPPGALIISTVTVYGTAVFPSTASIGVLNYFTQDVSTLSTSIGVSLEYNYYGWATSSQLFSTISGLGGTGLISSGQLFSTVEGLGTYGYISSLSFYSTIDGLGTLGYVSSSQLVSTTEGLSSLMSTFFFGTAFPQFMPSTVRGLGTAGYISSSQLTSTVVGLSNAGYVNSNQLASTVIGLGNSGYLSQTSLTSTVIGLGTAGYVSSSFLTSQINANNRTLALLGYVSSQSLASTVTGLGTAGYVSTSQLQSTIIGLGGVGLISSGQLFSTVEGLGTVGYISAPTLYSTSIGLQKSFYVVNANNVYVTNSQVSISSIQNIIYLSSILFSSMTYKGTNSQILASNNVPISPFLYFSSAVLPIDLVSSYITPRSLITIEAYPAFLFSPVGPYGGAQIYMSTFLQNGKNYLSTFQTVNMFYPTSTNDSNYFSPSIKISVPANILSNYFGTGSPIYLSHYLPNAVTLGGTPGVVNCNVTVFYGSTNSVFLSVQNLP